MKANKTAQGHRPTAHRSLTPLVRASFILAATAVVCLAMAGVVWASIPETSNQATQTLVTSPADLQQAKTLANTDADQTVRAPLIVAQADKYQQAKTLANTDADQTVRAPVIVGRGPAPNAAAADSPLVAGIVLSVMAVAACVAVAYGLRRSRAVHKPAVATPLVAEPIAGREHRKAA